MNCPNCGSVLEDGLLFCTHCGKRIDTYDWQEGTSPSDKQDQPQNGQSTAPQQQVPPAYGYAPQNPPSQGASAPPQNSPPQYGGYPPQQPQPPYAQGYPYNPPRKKRKTYIGVIFSVLALIGAIILAILLSNQFTGGLKDTLLPNQSSPARTSAGTAATSAPAKTGTQVTPKPTPTPAKLSDSEMVSFFTEITCYSEYGNDDAGYVKRWEQSIKVEIAGSYTEEDYKQLTDYINEIKAIEGIPSLSIVKSGGNIKVYFVPQNQIKNYISGYVSGNDGFTYLTWDGSKRLTKALCAIATDTTTQQKRNYLIHHEFMHCLGPLNDSSFKTSVLSKTYYGVSVPGEMDWRALRILYSGYIKAGMNASTAGTNVKKWLAANK